MAIIAKESDKLIIVFESFKLDLSTLLKIYYPTRMFMALDFKQPNWFIELNCIFLSFVLLY